MELTNNTEQLLSDINADNGGNITFNTPVIQKELAADAAAYSGLGIKILSIAGGLLGSLFFLGFIAMIINQSAEGLVIFGAMAIAGAVWVERSQSNTALDAACIGAYLAGFAMLGFGIGEMDATDNTVIIALLIVAVIVLFFTPGYMVSFFTGLIITGCLFAFITANDAYNLIHLLTAFTGFAYMLASVYEARLLAAGTAVNRLYAPLHISLLFSFLALMGFLATVPKWESRLNTEWISSGIIIALIVFALNHITAFINTENRTRIIIYVLGAVVLGPVIYAPAICGAILILLLSYHTGNRVGLVMGIAALVYFTGQYYYDLNFSLLAKSGMMFGTGALFLAAWFILKKQLQRYES
ncbi:MAG: DUF4401 domain-containing protein [Sphingobacteriales bacterium]|nr:MAG: DUF4401 domain-containing protein [Sphingobacteriales bacterium]